MPARRSSERHRGSIEPGRTLLQQALPLTFGLKAAAGSPVIDGAIADLTPFASASSRSSSGAPWARSRASAIVVSMLPLSWPTSSDCRPPTSRGTRSGSARRGSHRALGATLGVTGKIGRDVVLLAQTEVAEVIEGGGEGRGGSSTMPHKRNPVGAIGLVACAQRGPGLVATMLAAMIAGARARRRDVAGRMGDAARSCCA